MTRNDLVWVHTRTHFGRVIGDGKRLNIRFQVINKREEILVSPRRCWVGASYIHRSKFEGNFGVLYVAKWAIISRFSFLLWQGSHFLMYCSMVSLILGHQ